MSSVLIVDDSAFCREPIARVLQHHGYEVSQATSAEDALIAVQKAPPDLMLLDLGLPRVDGVTFLKYLRSNPSWRRIPVIVLTERGDKRSILSTRTLGVQGYLLKSQFSLDNLLARVSDQLGRDPGAPALPVPGTPRAATDAIEKSQVELPGLSREETLAHLMEFSGLKTLAGAVAEVVALCSSSRAERADLAAALARDPVLATNVLRVANSAAYSGGAGAIRDIEQAVGKIGFSAVRNIAASVGVFEIVSGRDVDPVATVRCWQQSLAMATVMDRIAAATSDISGGVAHLIGLCHALGEIALRQYFPDQHRCAIELAAQPRVTLRQAETRMFGIDHGELTTLMLEKLSFPREISKPICEYFQNSSASIQRNESLAAHALRFAGNYAHGMLFASGVEAGVSPVSALECRDVVARSVADLSIEDFRAQIIMQASLLARLSSQDVARLTEPLIRHAEISVCYVRHASYIDPDPLLLALRMVANPVVEASLPQHSEANEISHLIVAAPTPASAPLSVKDVAEWLKHGPPHRPLTLHVSRGAIGGGESPDHRIDTVHPCLSLRALSDFLQRKPEIV